MKEVYTAVIKHIGQWWIGWIEEVPGVNCQEASKETLLASLRTTLREALEFNRQEAREAAGEGFEEESKRYETERISPLSPHSRLRVAPGREEPFLDRVPRPVSGKRYRRKKALIQPIKREDNYGLQRDMAYIRNGAVG